MGHVLGVGFDTDCLRTKVTPSREHECSGVVEPLVSISVVHEPELLSDQKQWLQTPRRRRWSIVLMAKHARLLGHPGPCLFPRLGTIGWIHALWLAARSSFCCCLFFHFGLCCNDVFMLLVTSHSHAQSEIAAGMLGAWAPLTESLSGR